VEAHCHAPGLYALHSECDESGKAGVQKVPAAVRRLPPQAGLLHADDLAQLQPQQGQEPGSGQLCGVTEAHGDHKDGNHQQTGPAQSDKRRGFDFEQCSSRGGFNTGQSRIHRIAIRSRGVWQHQRV